MDVDAEVSAGGESLVRILLSNKAFVKGTRRFLTLDYSGSANIEARDVVSAVGRISILKTEQQRRHPARTPPRFRSRRFPAVLPGPVTSFSRRTSPSVFTFGGWLAGGIAPS